MYDWADYHDEREDRLATDAEAVNEYARNIGGEFPDRAWLIDSRDVWVKNPHYAGPPVPHPEDDRGDYDGEPEPFEINDEIPF
jgi:hypothetical protein